MTKHIKTEIVIPVHDETRPIRRAVDSVLADAHSRALVIAHNIDPEVLDLPEDDRVRILPLEGAHGMPGATFDAGIAAAEAEWVGIMGSDDWYQPGALETMRSRAAADRADGVIAPLTHQQMDVNQIKPFTARTSNLQAARDRMFYRTAPLGIYRTDLMQEERFRFGDTFPAGSDMRVTALLWTAGASISYYWDDPAYVVGKDAKTRVTFSPRPLEQTGRPWQALFEEPEVRAFDAATTHALAVKMATVNVLSAVLVRNRESLWLPGDWQWLRAFTEFLMSIDPRLPNALALRDQRVIAALLDDDVPETLSAIALRGNASMRAMLLGKNPAAGLTDPQSPLWITVAARGAILKSSARARRR